MIAVKRTNIGLGLFALQDILPGQRIIEYTGPLISNDEVAGRKFGKYFFRINTKWVIDGSPRANTARYINHSCRPNSEAFISAHRVWIWSKKSIKAREEISLDYGEEYFDDHIKPRGCKCAGCFVRPKPGAQFIKTEKERPPIKEVLFLSDDKQGSVRVLLL